MKKSCFLHQPFCHKLAHIHSTAVTHKVELLLQLARSTNSKRMCETPTKVWDVVENWNFTTNLDPWRGWLDLTWSCGVFLGSSEKRTQRCWLHVESENFFPVQRKRALVPKSGNFSPFSVTFANTIPALCIDFWNGFFLWCVLNFVASFVANASFNKLSQPSPGALQSGTMGQFTPEEFCGKSWTWRTPWTRTSFVLHTGNWTNSSSIG